MDLDKAWEIVKEFYRIGDFKGDELILYEEALNYILVKSIELSEDDSSNMWKTDVQAGAYNLAAHYERIGKYELAIKYFEISEEYGCSFARDKIGKIQEMIVY